MSGCNYNWSRTYFLAANPLDPYEVTGPPKHPAALEANWAGLNWRLSDDVGISGEAKEGDYHLARGTTQISAVYEARAALYCYWCGCNSGWAGRSD